MAGWERQAGAGGEGVALQTVRNRFIKRDMDAQAEPMTIDISEVGSEWFLDQLEASPMVLEPLRAALEDFYARGLGGEADELADLLQEALISADRVEEAVGILQLRAGISGREKGFREVCEKSVARIVEGNREHRIRYEHSGFDKKLQITECLRRFRVLLALAEGQMCHDKTWGFGIIKGVDSFYQRVAIEFARKRGHEMSFAYASAALAILDEEHLLARKHRDPDGLSALVRENAAEVVRITLRSYGPLPVQILQETLVPDVLEEASWKKFWDAARKGLKADPMVDIPKKRSEPIRLREKAFAYDDEWFSRLAKERRIPTLLEQIGEWMKNHPSASPGEVGRAVLVDRLRFSVKGADGTDACLLIRSLMTSKSLGISAAEVGASGIVEGFFSPERAFKLIRKLPVKELKGFIEYAADQDETRTLDVLERLLPGMPYFALDETIGALLKRGRRDPVLETLRRLLDTKKFSLDMLAWISRHLDTMSGMVAGALPALLNDMLTALEQGDSVDGIRAINALSSRFESSEWLGVMVKDMTEPQRRNFLSRMRETSAFPEMDRRSILGRIIKLYPELESVMASGDEPVDVRPQGRFTSERSFVERQEQLRKLVNVEIPKNSKEIAVARSYGDLRENHEFKAAKEMQSILMRRQAEFEEMLNEVMPTDFEGIKADRVGMGTGVRVVAPDGRENLYYILGEWDRDETLGIISCTTRMAQALNGYSAGDSASAPSEHGDVTVKVLAVSILPEHIREWAKAPAVTELET
jgi:transcription elongation GreA/GreB family factor